MRTVIQIILAIAIVILGFLVYDSIMTPIRFNKLMKVRETATINRLIDIREAQKAYKDVKLKYTDNFDTLIAFLKNDSFAVTKAIGTIPEELIDSVGIRRARDLALARGIIRREITKVPVKDSILGKNYPVDSLQYVPYTNHEKFEMTAQQTETSGMNVRVVEVKVPYKILLKGLDEQLVINYADERQIITTYPGLKFGSLTEGTLTGNWE
jgi:hypothetical protein